MSWDCPVFPIDAKNSIGFLVQFFLSYTPLVGDSVSRAEPAEYIEKGILEAKTECYAKDKVKSPP